MSASDCLGSCAAMLRLINFDILSLETLIKPKDMHQDAPQITSYNMYKVLNVS